MNRKANASCWPAVVASVTVVFVVLRLTGVVSWSWWWVFSPLWGSVALGLALFIVAVIILYALMPPESRARILR